MQVNKPNIFFKETNKYSVFFIFTYIIIIAALKVEAVIITLTNKTMIV